MKGRYNLEILMQYIVTCFKCQGVIQEIFYKPDVFVLLSGSSTA